MVYKRHCLLMISCPGDVVHEIELLRHCVEIINTERDDDLWVELRYWVNDTISDAKQPAQESINEQIVQDSDGLIAIFNARLGTPVHDYPCGTDEEINLMLKAGKHVSLLFNNKPTIDLTKADVLDQLKNLQEYKADKRSLTYYKTFDSDESFINTAKQEIRFWLRALPKICAPEDQPSISNEKEITFDNTDHGENEVSLEPNNNSIVSDPLLSQSEDGIIDIIINFTNTANELSERAAEHGKDLTELGNETDRFNDQYQYLAKAGKTATLQTACISFANKIIKFSDKANEFNKTFAIQWYKARDSLLSFEKLIKNNDDRIIMRENILKLEKSFSSTHESFVGFLTSVENIPNVQRDFNNARKELAKSTKETCRILEEAIQNCESLIDKYNSMNN